MSEPQQELEDLQERWLEYDPDTCAITINVSEAAAEGLTEIEVRYDAERHSLFVEGDS